MAWLFVFAAFMVLVAVVLSVARGSAKAPKKGQECGYIRTDALFTPAERAFLAVLERAVGEHYRVFGKVRVADVLEVRPTQDNSARQRAFNRINAKHFDFVLCRGDDLSIVAVIELNDSSHKRAHRKARDHFLANACTGAGLPLIEIPAQQAYSISELRGTIGAALGMVPEERTESAH